MSLPQKILITGSAVRTGKALALHLAEKGAAIVIHANSSISAAQELCKILPGTGHTFCSGNLADENDVEKLCRAAKECDGIVLNASCYRYNYQGGDPDFDKLLEQVNCRAQLKILDAFASANHPDGGAVVAMLDQEITSNHDNPYLQSRRALWHGMKQLAMQYGRYNLRFNAIAPGPMLPPPELGETKMVKTLPTLPLKRSVALKDVALAAEMLLANNSITGALLHVDCGQSLVNRNEIY